MSRLHLKLVALLAPLVVAVALASGTLAERALHAREIASIESSLVERAGLVRELLAGGSLSASAMSDLDALADRAGAAAGARVTLIAPDGRVVGDSDVGLATLGNVENHGSRPEVAAALGGAVARTTRRSHTVGRHLLYVAVPAGAGEGSGVVRLAVDLDDVDVAVAGLRRELIAAGVLGLVAALVLSFPIVWLTLRPVRELRDVVRSIADGQLDRRLRWDARGELGEIARSINSVAEQLRLRLDEALSDKEQLEVVLASMVEGVLVVDASGHILLANPRLRELLSAWGDVEGRTALELTRQLQLDDALRAAAASHEPVVREIEVEGPDPRILLVHAVRFASAGGRTGTVAVLHDVTEIRRLEQVRTEFIASASHELRTPLTSIRGFADILLANPLSDDERQSYLERIVRNANRLGALIEDLFELSRIESRRTPLRPSEVDVVELCQMLVEDLGPRLREASLEATVRDERSALALADRRAVEQIVTNLLDNAIKYSDPGGRIEVRVGADASNVRVSVIDEGIGVPKEDCARIFERFYRVDKARSRALGGTGLGLAIVKHLVQSLSGEISVESEPGRGSTFRFTLPRA